MKEFLIENWFDVLCLACSLVSFVVVLFRTRNASFCKNLSSFFTSLTAAIRKENKNDFDSDNSEVQKLIALVSRLRTEIEKYDDSEKK